MSCGVEWWDEGRWLGDGGNWEEGWVKSWVKGWVKSWVNFADVEGKMV